MGCDIRVQCQLSGKPVVVVKKGRRKKSRTLFRQALKEEENNFKVVDTVHLDGEGVLKVAVSDETGDLFGLSNPIVLEPADEKPMPAEPEEKQEGAPEQAAEQAAPEAAAEAAAAPQAEAAAEAEAAADPEKPEVE